MSTPTSGRLPSPAEPYVIAEDFCGDCGESFGFDVRPLALRCPNCALVAGDVQGFADLTAPARVLP